MSTDLKRVFIGHVGCHAALPALDVARSFVLVENKPAVILCLELPSLHVQPATVDLEDVVIHALFSDAASAIVLESQERPMGGFSVLDVVSETDSNAADAMTWTITDSGFRMTLSRHVPDIVAAAVGPLVDRVLERNGLTRDDISHWALHPGGPRILDAVRDRLDLQDDAIALSRGVLSAHGNCSSATMLLVLEELLLDATCLAGNYVLALSFGPGLTLCAALLQRDGSTREKLSKIAP
jgi:predicted naringenin-chalcone synthase